MTYQSQSPLYSEYERHIQEFDDKIYFANKNMGADPIFDDKIDNFYNFLTIYKKAEEEDAKKSALFFNHKFKKGGGGGGGAGAGAGMSEGGGGRASQYNQSGYSYNLTNFHNPGQKQKQVKTWNSYAPKNADEKLISLIESNLNKISDESYKKISIDFVNELIQLNDPGAGVEGAAESASTASPTAVTFFFDIIAKKIVDKCVMDNKYQHLYIHLCNKIWSNRQIHYHLATIEEGGEDGRRYYWRPKTDHFGPQTRRGPFQNEMEAKMNIFHELNFKRYFMNYIQQLFVNKNVNFAHIENDEEFFLHKRQFMVIIEVLGIMYMEKYIPVDILHLVVMKLLHMTDIGIKIEPIEVDGVLQILKIMSTYKEKYGISDFFKVPIFNEYHDYITHIEMYEEFNIRTKYFLTDCKDIIREVPKGPGSKVPEKSPSSASISSPKASSISTTDLIADYDAAMEKMKGEKKKGNISGMIATCEKMTEEVREKVLYDIIYRYCESHCKDEIYEGFLRKFIGKSTTDIFLKAMEGIIANMAEIQIDIPDVIDVVREFVKFMEGLDVYSFAQIVELNEKIYVLATTLESGTGEEDDGNFW